MAKTLSVAALTVLHAVGSGTAHGFDIIDTTGLPGGTVYPSLTRMERDGLVESEWEDSAEARAEKRPARRYYRITREGVRVLNEALARVHALAPLRAPRQARSRGTS
jgi:PadR family transcriptional regulator, regulatory protein PadR